MHVLRFFLPTKKITAAFIPLRHWPLLSRILAENFSANRYHYLIALCAMIITALMTALTAWIIRDVVNQLFVYQDMQEIYWVAGIVAVIFFTKGLGVFIQQYLLTRIGNRIIAEQQRKVHHRILQHGLAFFHEMTTSRLLARVTIGANGVKEALGILITSLGRDLLALIGLVFVMFVQQPRLSLLVFVFAPFAVLGITRILKKLKKITTQEMSGQARIIEILQESSLGIRVIKSFNLEQSVHKQMQAAICDVELRRNKIARLNALTSPIMETLGGLAIAAVIVIGGLYIVKAGSMPGELMSFLTALLLAYEPAKRLAKVRVGFEKAMIEAQFLFQIRDMPVEICESNTAKPLRLQKGEVVFEKISFAYHKDNAVLQNFDLHVKAGQFVALVGPSGGGKSTVINLLMRLYDPRQGRILIDGQPIKQVTLSSLRQNISYVSQDTFLFSDNVGNNIRIGHESASEKEIIAAAKRADAHDFICALPQGYDTHIGANGEKLSGGQKQRLALARAFLKQARIVVLDEVTSALDSESEEVIKQTLAILAQKSTIIAIAHRFSTIRAADYICVMRDGQIQQQGTHNQLISQKGLYFRLYGLHYDQIRKEDRMVKSV